VFEFGNGKATEWHVDYTDVRPKVIVKDDGAAVTKAGGTDDVPEGGDVRDERWRRVNVFREGTKHDSEGVKCDSEGAKQRGCCTECVNDINGWGTISEKFLKEINKRERDA
jgi:hypothetical protein